MTTNRTRTAPLVTLSIAALAVGLALSACSAPSDATPAPTVSATAAPASTAAPVADTNAPDATSAPAVVADEWSQVINGTLYQGTESAPVKIGTDTPGQPPALDGTLPDPQVDFETFKAAAIGIDAAKYTVVIAPVFEVTDTLGEGSPIGYRWMVFRVNEYGNWKMGDKSTTFATSQEAADAPKTLGGRTLDRSEYVVVYY